MIDPPQEFGEEGIVLTASRSWHQARRYPLAPGDQAWVGLRRIHALPHPGLRLLAVVGGEAGDAAAVTRAVDLARRADARLTVLMHDGSAAAPTASRPGGSWGRSTKRSPARRSATRSTSSSSPRHGRTPPTSSRARCAPAGITCSSRAGGPDPFDRALVCVAGGEQAKVDVLFAGRLLRHIGAQVTVLLVVPGEDPDPAVDAHAERFLAASAKTLGSSGVKARRVVRRGDAVARIEEEARAGRYGLVLLGSPPLPADTSGEIGGPVGRLLSSASMPSILVVRSTS